jgi:hypothetical protein
MATPSPVDVVDADQPLRQATNRRRESVGFIDRRQVLDRALGKWPRQINQGGDHCDVPAEHGTTGSSIGRGQRSDMLVPSVDVICWRPLPSRRIRRSYRHCGRRRNKSPQVGTPCRARSLNRRW